MGFDYVSPSKPKRVAHDLEQSTMRCAHCGRAMNNFAGGSSRVAGKPLCHPNAPNRPNCYELVDRYKHSMPCETARCYEDHPRPILDYAKIDDKVPF